MKIMSFERDGAPGFGVARDDGVVDMGARLGAKYPSLKAAMAADALGEVAAAAEGQTADFGFDDVVFAPVIPDPDKIICVGLNYAKHIKETGRKENEYPALFVRFANSLVAHKQAMVKPDISDRFDWEGELAVIIGRPARHVDRADSLSYVAGYACLNDGSVRDWQFHANQHTPGKNFKSSGAFGPWMVTADEVPDPSKLTLVTRLNGEEMQRAGTDELIFDIPYLIAYISTFTELVPGDVISTGTPGGVGARREPPLFMKPGDTIEVEIDAIGTLANPVVAE